MWAPSRLAERGGLGQQGIALGCGHVGEGLIGRGHEEERSGGPVGLGEAGGLDGIEHRVERGGIAAGPGQLLGVESVEVVEEVQFAGRGGSDNSPAVRGRGVRSKEPEHRVARDDIVVLIDEHCVAGALGGHGEVATTGLGHAGSEAAERDVGVDDFAGPLVVEVGRADQVVERDRHRITRCRADIGGGLRLVDHQRLEALVGDLAHEGHEVAVTSDHRHVERFDECLRQSWPVGVSATRCVPGGRYR